MRRVSKAQVFMGREEKANVGIIGNR